MFLFYDLQQKDSPVDGGVFDYPNGQVHLHQSPNHMEDHVRPKMDA